MLAFDGFKMTPAILLPKRWSRDSEQVFLRQAPET